MRGKYLNVGTDCVVNVPKMDVENFAILGKYNGQAMKVAKKVLLGNGLPYFELEGAVSDKGIPYAFVREWLIAF
jgi:hypothetical protein